MSFGVAHVSTNSKILSSLIACCAVEQTLSTIAAKTVLGDKLGFFENLLKRKKNKDIPDVTRFVSTDATATLPIVFVNHSLARALQVCATDFSVRCHINLVHA